jgi:hypothetical protein
MFHHRTNYELSMNEAGTGRNDIDIIGAEQPKRKGLSI